MNKNAIMNDFMKAKEEGLIEDNFNTYEELLDVLSEMFSDIYDKSSDAQEAFDDLDYELDGLLNKNCAVYTLGTKEWEIMCSAEASEDIIKQSINEWNQNYSNVEDINDLCDSITHRILKDMSNCGCDVHNALAMICNEVFTNEDIFYIDLGEENPRISFLD